jgi:hypothetical protein
MNTTVAGALPVRSEGRYFYLWMAGICVLVAFGGFIPTFWAKVAAGSFHAEPMIYIHGTLLFTWTIFYFSQTALIALGRTMDHRAWGLAGISLFSIMMCAILVTEMAVLKRADAQGVGDAGRRFAAVTLCAWPMMAGFFTLAIINVRRPQIHKRLMLMLMIGMLTPANARVFLTFFAPPGAASAGPPPPFVSLPPGLVADLLILVAMYHDWRTRGRPHPVYVFGGLALLTQQALTIPFAATATWMSIATAFEHLAG